MLSNPIPSRLRLVAPLAAALLFMASSARSADVDPALLAGIRARAIGPAGMSGRVAALAVAPDDRNVIYVGAATGGVWKSTNGGMHWTPVFDDQDVHAIGAITVSPLSSNVVWVGTGEGNVRNSASVGRGVYRSRDGGRTWEHLGLAKTERIERIVLHPRDPDIAWVAALGRAWGENPERGVFRTDDGGKTWRKILYVDERTGAADLVADPTNPDKLIAAMWEYRRWPWFFKSGGPGSGLYLTIDGGETWRKATPKDGLPDGELGRIGVAIAASDPRIVYALVEATKSALLRSQDGGYTWKSVNDAIDVSDRPFYYANLSVDPERPDRVYRVASLVDVSIDGGKSFETLIPFMKLHPDHHAFWIDPQDGAFILDGNDGGVGISYDRGESWRFVTNLPFAQFYHVRHDMETPYNLYGGLQDNGSWRGPSSRWAQGPIRNSHWQEVGFGDGFDTSPDPENARRGYAMSQDGYLVRWDLDKGERRAIRPSPPPGVEALRFNWNAGFAQDPFDAATIYYGSQFLHRSTDRGETWIAISPDLTSNDPEKQKSHESGGLTPDVTAAENHTTIVAIAPSARERGVVWVGTDDGRVQVTRDGGGHWTNVAGGAKGVPADTWVPHITPSPHADGTAFVVFDNHRRSDWTPYLFRVEEYGKKWTSLSRPEIDGYALVLIQDPVEPRLLYLGTEFGLYLSFDGGGKWHKWTHGVPTASVMDLAVHPREHDLIVATHGRALYVLDDIRPLRAVARGPLEGTLTLFTPGPAQQYMPQANILDSINSQSEFQGANRAYGAFVDFYLDVAGIPHPDPEVERLRAPVKPAEGAVPTPSRAAIEVRDREGALVRRFEVDVHRGLNRAVWDLRRDAYRSPAPPSPWGGGVQPPVVPGDYTVDVVFGETRKSAPLAVLADPRLDLSADDYARKAADWRRLGAAQEAIADGVRLVVDLRADLDRLAALAKSNVDRRQERDPAGKIADDDPHKALGKQIGAFEEKLLVAEKALWQPPASTKGIVAETDAQSLVGTASSFLGSSLAPASPTQLDYVEKGIDAARAALGSLAKLVGDELPAIHEAADALGLAHQSAPAPVAF